MNKSNFWFKLILFTLLVPFWLGCEFMSYEEFAPDPYDGAFTWTEVNSSAEWGNRFDHAAVSYDGYLWIFGGYNPGKTSGDTYYEDVWRSADGTSWEMVIEKAPWNGRRGHEVVVFDDGSGEALYLIGGFMVDETTGYRQYANDVWRSTNGSNWLQIKETVFPPVDSLFDWYPRMEHSCVVKEVDGIDFIYLVAGRSMQDSIDGRFATIYHNDVWRSADGIDWERLANNNFGIRGDQAFTINPETGRMYMQGGTHGYVFTPENYGTHPTEDWHYLWHSDDGINWQAVNDTATWDQGLLWRSSHHIIHYDNSLWSLPGKTVSNEHYLFAKSQYYPIWRLHDNGEYEVDSYGAAFDPRHGYACVIHNNKVWILGGFTSNSAQDNDVWVGEIR